MASEPLYKRIMGEEFNRLPSALRAFHMSPTGGRGSGGFEVRRMGGPIGRMIAALGGLPRPGRDVHVDLEVRVMGDREIWRRIFNGRAMTTTQWEKDGLLAERAGPATFLFALRGTEDGMLFEPRGMRLLGMPVPPFLAMRVAGVVRGGEGGWDLEITISAPIVGTITSYTGHIVPS